MRVEEDGKLIVLSRRNLLMLLAKLDGHPPNSKCSIQLGSGIRVLAEEDSVHYASHPPEKMAVETELALNNYYANGSYKS